LGGLKLVAGFTRKKASTRRVNRKIADFTRNQRVFFSRYLAANYGWDTIPSAGRLMQRIVEYVKVQVDISIIAGELDSSGQPYPLDCHDRLFTEDDDADATTYDSDADDAACSGDELWAQGGTVPPDPWSLD